MFNSTVIYNSQTWLTMMDLLPSLLRHLCTTVASMQILVHPQPYSPHTHTSVTGTSVHTTHCDMPLCSTTICIVCSVHLRTTAHDVMAYDSNTHDSAVTSPGGSRISTLLHVWYLSRRLSTRNLFNELLNNSTFCQWWLTIIQTVLNSGTLLTLFVMTSMTPI